MAKYVNDKRLTDEVIEEMLNKCGLKIIKKKIDDRTGEVFESGGIMRGEDTVMVNCKNVEMSNLANQVFSRFPQLGILNTSAYSMGEEFVLLEDFFASRFKITEEIEPLDEKLFQVYYETMSSIFGEEYEKDAEASFEEIRKAEKNEKGETKESEPENTPEMG